MFYPETPLSLQSICRLTVRKTLGIHHLSNVDKLGLVPPYDDFMAFRELFISAGQNLFETHILSISKLNRVLKEVAKDPIVRGKFAQCPAQDLLRKRGSGSNMNFTQPEQTLVVVPDEEDEPEVGQQHDPPPAPPPNNGAGGPPAPPPPPPAPLPPRPG